MEIKIEDVKNELARRHLLHFTQRMMETFEPTDFHKNYYEVLDRFAKGEIKRLMITISPQHGKSLGSSRQLPSYMLGHNPDINIAIASYSTPFARKFNRDVQRIIDTPLYAAIFPETKLNASNVVTISSNYLRNADEFEVVNKLGGLKSVGRGGALTGTKVDIMIMDDLYKDYMEGNSPTVRENVWDWYTSVVKTRLHNNSQELIVFTRWHEEDLIGMLEKKETVVTIESLSDLDNITDEWVKINYEAIKTTPKTDLDPREQGEALWPERHSEEKLIKLHDLDPEKFQCMNQGNPISSEGLLYSEFTTYSRLPIYSIKKNYTDTADTGDNFLCSIDYVVGIDDSLMYVIDVLYTDAPMESTEGWLAAMLIKDKINLVNVESNNGGRGFARTIDKNTPRTCVVDWFHQSGNKESRIFSNSAAVTRNIIMPDDWHIRWPEFFKAVKYFKKNFKANKLDDAADVLTGMVEIEVDNFVDMEVEVL